MPQIYHVHFGLGHQASDKSSTMGPSGVCRAKNSSKSLWHIDLAKFQGEAFIQKKLFARLTLLHITRFYSNLISINPLLLQKFGPDHAAEEEKQGPEPRINDGKRYVKNCLTSHS